MLITCVMRHARLQKLQRLRREWPVYVFLFYDPVFPPEYSNTTAYFQTPVITPRLKTDGKQKKWLWRVYKNKSVRACGRKNMCSASSCQNLAESLIKATYTRCHLRPFLFRIISKTPDLLT